MLSRIGAAGRVATGRVGATGRVAAAGRVATAQSGRSRAAHSGQSRAAATTPRRGTRYASAVAVPASGDGRQIIQRVIKTTSYLATNFPPLRVPILRLCMSGYHSVESKTHWRNYEPTEHDVIAASFIKSGTNWLLQIQYQIATRGEGDFEHIHDVVPWPDGLPIVPFQRSLEDLRDPNSTKATPTGMNVLKTHCAADAFDEDAPCKVVTVFRDPKEVIASAYPFMLGLWGLKDVVTIDEYVDTLFAHGTMFEKLATLTASYWERRHRPNNLFLVYRDMKADPRANIARVADVMGVALTPEEFDKVCHKASVGYMKGIGHKFAFGKEKQTVTIRSGESGKAVDELGLRQSRRIDNHMRELILAKAPDFPYDKFCDLA